MLKRPVLFVVLRAVHLLLEFGDLLLVQLDVALQFLAFFLVSGEGCAVGFEAAQVRLQRLFDHGNVLGKRGDFFFERYNPLIQRLQLGHQMSIWVHGILILTRVPLSS